MAEYIPKSTLVAEITHKIKVLEAFIKNFDGISDKVEKAKNKIEALGDVLLSIENLEAKDVDLEKLAEQTYPYPCPMWFAGDDKGYEEAEKKTNSLREAFKLGFIKAQKGEKI